MKVLVYKVTKNYRNGTREHYIVLTLDYELKDPDVWARERAEQWAERDPAGQNYGYDLEWNRVEDVSVCKRVLAEKKENYDKQIKEANEKIAVLDSALDEIDQYEEHVADVAINIQKDEENHGPV